MVKHEEKKEFFNLSILENKAKNNLTYIHLYDVKNYKKLKKKTSHPPTPQAFNVPIASPATTFLISPNIFADNSLIS